MVLGPAGQSTICEVLLRADRAPQRRRRPGVYMSAKAQTGYKRVEACEHETARLY